MPTLNNIVLAVYIDASGKVVATEKITGSRDIIENQLDLNYGTTTGDVLNVDVRVTRTKPGNAECSDCREYMALRTCYDLSGRRVPCF